ncbi:LSM domain containing protein [Entamoeba histolytica HM-1:IMSS-B]|uniref:Small nuclear ribonucleoprotein Sm D2 n=9 Tax=Entamoeba TaxID=5758 RepID=C4M843_ENTH1|nr:small nuclear ribonucleoprotein sm D2, putative [Entamoeba dispar SAW760]XP_001739631.1 small nuclear ribonucleoprotein sm D2, putative [Entamoeba dispar SAW760]XP_008857693.1 LSM domain containing protein [Entamoeba nuttalli P19]XP_651333.1 small nuclear ribonucleoprotein Sm D2, putative [Entamoeba histolytica HM-1:IMSS]EMD48820.1 small nuclear ribonucleoprotein sm D2, putative [Entamoeba histolytica KU27]EMH73581.1 LSM domain containing protein [Entamoeba histolytica HM-1:IMSS-B]EMS17807|eukprot:EDR23988.1 small nuclear ribonucleoprotein sm D2, putative [Entamoeba dispar SAW760]
MEEETKALVEGPFQLLTEAVEKHGQVLINCRNNKKLICRVKAFDRHFNMVLENIKEIWTEMKRDSDGKLKAKLCQRSISKMFLRGDSVIVIVKNPAELMNK